MLNYNSARKDTNFFRIKTKISKKITFFETITLFSARNFGIIFESEGVF